MARSKPFFSEHHRKHVTFCRSCIHMIYLHWEDIFFLHDRPWISLWIKLISNELDITCHVFASQWSGHCDVITNQLWCHQQSVKGASETWGCVKILVFSFILNTKITPSWAHKQFATWVHALFSMYSDLTLLSSFTHHISYLHCYTWHHKPPFFYV